MAVILLFSHCSCNVLHSWHKWHCWCWQVCYARILDSKRKFLEAALRYYELSQLEKREIGGRSVLFLLFHVHVCLECWNMCIVGNLTVTSMSHALIPVSDELVHRWEVAVVIHWQIFKYLSLVLSQFCHWSNCLCYKFWEMGFGVWQTSRWRRIAASSECSSHLHYPGCSWTAAV
jgi:hypothetical protein